MSKAKPLRFDVFRPQRSGIRKVLGDLEADIMELVWLRSGDAAISVREVYEEMRAQRTIAYTTVMSTMARLARKGLLEVDTAEQSYRYRPHMTEEALGRDIVRGVIGGLLMNFEGETLAYLESLRSADEPQAGAVERDLKGEVHRRRKSQKG